MSVVLPNPPDVPISYLGELKDQIDQAVPLSFDTQTALVFKLKEKLRQRADETDGRAARSHRERDPDRLENHCAESDGRHRPAMEDDSAPALQEQHPVPARSAAERLAVA